MKNVLWYVIGVLCGVLVMMMHESDTAQLETEEEGIEVVEVPEESKPLSGLKMFDTPQSSVPVKYLQITKIYPSGEAEAKEVEKIGTNYIDRDIKVLILPKEGENFYTNQIVTISSTQKAQRVGEYNTGYSILPVVRITSK